MDEQQFSCNSNLSSTNADTTLGRSTQKDSDNTIISSLDFSSSGASNSILEFDMRLPKRQPSFDQEFSQTNLDPGSCPFQSGLSALESDHLSQHLAFKSLESSTSVFFGGDAPTSDELRSFFDMPSSENIVQHSLQEHPLHQLNNPTYGSLANNLRGEELDIFPVIPDANTPFNHDFDVSDPSIWTSMTFMSDWNSLGTVSSLPEVPEISELPIGTPVIARSPRGQPADDNRNITIEPNSLQLPSLCKCGRSTPSERQGSHDFAIHSMSNLDRGIEQVPVFASDIPFICGPAVQLQRRFGPSRPVQLPPAHRGGRKGKLSSSEKLMRMESRMKGVCIRCRLTKTKCIGGIPCKACLKNARAVLWIYPCVKAHFLDIVQSGSFFFEISSMQRKFIDDLNGDRILQQCFIAHHLAKIGLELEITAQLPDVGIIKGFFKWAPAANLLKEIFKNEGIKLSAEDCMDKIQILTGLQIAQAPRRLAQSKIVHAIDFPDLESLRQQIKIILLCFLNRTTACDFSVKGNNSANVDASDRIHEVAVKIQLWIYLRTAEITLFQNLQHAANRLGSMPTEEKLRTIKDLWDILLIGLSEIYHAENSHPLRAEENRVAAGELRDRHRRVRAALFVYLKVAIDKLPAWSEPWRLIVGTEDGLTPETIKINMENLESFGNGSEDDRKESISRMAVWYAYVQKERTRHRISNDYRDQDRRGKTNLDMKAISKLPRLLIGSYEISDVEDVVNGLRGLFEPRILSMIETLQWQHFLSSFFNPGPAEILLVELPKRLEAARQTRRALEEKLVEQAASGYNIIADSEVKTRFRAVVELVSETEEMYKAAFLGFIEDHRKISQGEIKVHLGHERFIIKVDAPPE